MTVYESITLMFSFATLIVTIIALSFNFPKKQSVLYTLHARSIY